MKKPYRVLWSKTAEKDLENTLTFVAKESPVTALRILEKVRTKASLKQNPKRGRSLP